MVYVSNLAPLRDIGGRLMDVHDGTIAQWQSGGRYYMCTAKMRQNPPDHATRTKKT